MILSEFSVCRPVMEKDPMDRCPLGHIPYCQVFEGNGPSLAYGKTGQLFSPTR